MIIRYQVYSHLLKTAIQEEPITGLRYQHFNLLELYSHHCEVSLEYVFH